MQKITGCDKLRGKQLSNTKENNGKEYNIMATNRPILSKNKVLSKLDFLLIKYEVKQNSANLTTITMTIPNGSNPRVYSR